MGTALSTPAGEKNCFMEFYFILDNFLMGMKSMGNTVYIIDFGLSKRYRDPQSLVHIPWKSNRSLTGILKY